MKYSKTVQIPHHQLKKPHQTGGLNKQETIEKLENAQVRCSPWELLSKKNNIYLNELISVCVNFSNKILYYNKVFFGINFTRICKTFLFSPTIVYVSDSRKIRKKSTSMYGQHNPRIMYIQWALKQVKRIRMLIVGFKLTSG